MDFRIPLLVLIKILKKQEKIDWSLRTGIYCREQGCMMYFETEDDYENHIQQGDHMKQHETTSMDSVLLYHTELILKSSNLKSICNINHEMTTTDEEVISQTELERRFSIVRRAVPVRKNARFSLKQKDSLYTQFMHGESTGCKTTAKKVLDKMRTLCNRNNDKVFIPTEYLSRQKKVLAFSRMSIIILSRFIKKT